MTVNSADLLTIDREKQQISLVQSTCTNATFYQHPVFVYSQTASCGITTSFCAGCDNLRSVSQTGWCWKGAITSTADTVKLSHDSEQMAGILFITKFIRKKEKEKQYWQARPDIWMFSRF